MVQKGNNKCSKLDLLEIYAYPKSNLTEVAQQCGLKAERFTIEDGDVSTSEGRHNLSLTIILRKPSHVWLSPECKPWCAWNRFNAQRSIQSFEQISRDRQASKVHLKLCNLVYKLQYADGRHTHLESPWSAETWNQQEIQEFLQGSLAAKMDQCMMGLKNPQNQLPMEKKTRIQTTSQSMFDELDQRVCNKQHQHSQIAGTCTWQGQSIKVSKFAAMYPRIFAKAIVKGIIKEKGLPVEIPTYHVSEIEERPLKRAKVRHPEEDQRETTERTEIPQTEENRISWKAVLDNLKIDLPKSGVKTWTNPLSQLFKDVQTLLPQYRIGAIKAGKGLDRFILGDQGWVDDLPRRYTVIMQRLNREILDLGEDDCSKMSKLQQHRQAKPSHVMICVFAERSIRDQNAIEPESSIPAEISTGSPVREGHFSGTSNPSIATWTPLSASTSGPKFLALSEEEQGIIRKLHTNLGHPTAEKLARHMSEARAQRHLVDAAKDYLCGACAEKQKPKLTTPGNLKDPKEFNERISMDGFEWKNKASQTFYVIHVLDEATRFHLGLRTSRDIQTTIRALHQIWFNWAGYPQQIAHDQGGEFMTDHWKDLLLENGIQPILSAAPWQRGRIERHGATVKDMLDRIDNEQSIEDTQQFDEALTQCFRAKNTMSIIDGFSP